jgi:hypothetical protein
MITPTPSTESTTSDYVIEFSFANSIMELVRIDSKTKNSKPTSIDFRVIF